MSHRHPSLLLAALALLVVFFVVLPALAWALFGRGRMEVLP